MRILKRSSLTMVFLGVVATVAASCGSDPASPDPLSLDWLVGDWNAEELVATSQADPGQSADLLEAGASFRINVQPSGQYTATLSFMGTPFTEIGFLEVDGDQLTLLRQFPSVDTSYATLTQLGPDRVRLLGDSSFDFDQDGSDEDATLRTDLVRQ